MAEKIGSELIGSIIFTMLAIIIIGPLLWPIIVGCSIYRSLWVRPRRWGFFFLVLFSNWVIWKTWTSDEVWLVSDTQAAFLNLQGKGAWLMLPVWTLAAIDIIRNWRKIQGGPNWRFFEVAALLCLGIGPFLFHISLLILGSA